MSGLERVSHLNPESISFSVFSKTELEKLFVKHIHSPLTFDNFGHPFPGGLYDKYLGPYGDKCEPCGTCLQNAWVCPGHFGYIQLPLPVVNALFFRTIVDVLKHNCFECFRLQAPPNFKTCLAVQVQLLDRGLVCDALELDVLCRHLWTDKNKPKDISAEVFNHLQSYQELIKVTSVSSNTSKNVETFRRELVCYKNLMSYIKKKNKNCIYCGAVTKTAKSLRNKIFVNDSIKTPENLKQYLRQIWEKDSEFLKMMVPFLNNVDSEYPTDLMFFEVVPVTPPINRPVNVLHGKILENEQTQVYREIIETSILLKHAVHVINSNDDPTSLSEEAMRMYNLLEGSNSIEKLNNLWELLQLRVDCLIDKPTMLKNTGGRGLKQLLEKKEGLIRMHMMGKRVNFSARTVITPDPYIAIEEIGIPLAFAKKVTIPVTVSHLNVTHLRTLILNGPEVHPGAVQVEFEDGSVIRLSATNALQRESIAKRLLTPHEKGFYGTKMVHRHVDNGDIALLNRQPTLHKPSIMGHTVRVLKSEKTLRLHYANCKPYNADFDGDEMNVHFPQNLVAQSEGYHLAKVPFQYLSVKDGSPLSGLIQDHVIAGVKLTTRGQFFTKSEYHQLVCQGLLYKTTEIKLLPPTIIKPQHLWSGKQVLSTIMINNLPPDRKLMNMVSKAKISAKAWVNGKPRKWLAGGTNFTHENEMSETEIVIRRGELLVGVLDKASFGTSSYGLIHRIYELYGGIYSSKMLSSFSILFTTYLQHIGFTISVQDILVSAYADRKRNKIIQGTRQMGKELICGALDEFHDLDIKEIAEKVSEARFRNPKMSAIIDSQYKQVLDKKTNEVNKTCLPAGLKCSFPDNNLQLMVQSGAKGSTVNTMQMSCLLGQVELEGKRPPLMISGKSLPSFPTSDFSPRAGGFIEGRFMTGIQPQELFFHSMAGREGLIDTTVKTSRSGYLQRCFIKLLEDLVVQYDMTVRDASGCVIQFLYGEDGLDVTKAQFLNDQHIEFLNENADLIINEELSKCDDEEDSIKIKSHLKEINEFREKFGTTLRKHRETPFKLFSEIAKKSALEKCEDPNKIYPGTGRSQLTKAILNMWSAFGEKEKLEKRCKKCPDPINSIMKPDIYPGSFSDKLNETLMNCTKNYKKKKAKKFEKILKSKVIRSHCDPGEAVGILAAQSLGEPCTQMTLNTFHFAGRGDMNVTLGIPRIREILMEAAAKIKTPNVTIPFLDIPDVEIQAEKLRKKLTRVTVADVLVDIEVENELMVQPCRQWVYRLKFSFLPYELYKSKYNIKPKKILKYMKTSFCPTLIKGIVKSSTVDTMGVDLSHKKNQEQKKQNENGESEDNSRPEDSEERDEDDDQSEKEEDYSDEETGSGDEDEENEDVNHNQDSEFEDEPHVEEEKISKKEVDFLYKSDIKDYLWCSIEFSFDVSGRKIDLTAILRDLANKSIIFGTPNIKKAIVYKKDGTLTLTTEGCNIPEMFKYHDLLDLNKLVSNDIHKMAEIYGIEAATQVISKEVKDVFKPYSITVDNRHLSLVADFMTFSGSYTPLNRRGIVDSVSPIQKISFESCLKFLKEAIIGGKVDTIKNPSSCIMIGKPIRVGTGCFDLINFSTEDNVV